MFFGWGILTDMFLLYWVALHNKRAQDNMAWVTFYARTLEIILNRNSGANENVVKQIGDQRNIIPSKSTKLAFPYDSICFPIPCPEMLFFWKFDLLLSWLISWDSLLASTPIIPVFSGLITGLLVQYLFERKFHIATMRSSEISKIPIFYNF